MGWKFYFWILTILIVGGTGLSIAESLGILSPEEGVPDEPLRWLDWLDMPITGISLVGLFGFAYKKIIGGQSFWKGWFIFILIYDTAYMVYQYYPEDFVGEEVWLDLLAQSFFIPLYIAFYLYGYKSDSLWNPQPTPPQ
jgi:hypothetical protein